MRVKKYTQVNTLKNASKSEQPVEKWLKYKDTDKTNKINVKQDIGLDREIACSHEEPNIGVTMKNIIAVGNIRK